MTHKNSEVLSGLETASEAKRFNPFKRVCSEYRENSSGQFAIMSALICGVMILGVGAAVDVTSVTNSKNKSQNVLDTSVMAVARSYQANPDKRAAKRIGRKVFRKQCKYGWCVEKTTPKFTLDDDGKGGVNVTGTYQGAQKAYLMGIFGHDKTLINNISSVGFSASSVPAHQEIYFVVDVSASLGIASTLAEQQRLKDLTKPFVSYMPGAEDGCAFACHMSESFIRPEINGVEVTTYEFAVANGINLLEDDMAEAVEGVVDDIFANESNTTKVGLYAVSDKLEQVQTATNIKFSVTSVLDKVAMPRYGTRFDVAMPDLTTKLGATGTGGSSNDPLKSIVLVTDGLNNNYGGGIQTSAFKGSYCSNLKANGVKVAVLHVPYPNLSGQSWYEYFAKPHLNQIPSELEACASEGLYFEVDRVSEIPDELDLIANTLNDVQSQELAFFQ